MCLEISNIWLVVLLRDVLIIFSGDDESTVPGSDYRLTNSAGKHYLPFNSIAK